MRAAVQRPERSPKPFSGGRHPGGPPIWSDSTAESIYIHPGEVEADEMPPCHGGESGCESHRRGQSLPCRLTVGCLALNQAMMVRIHPGQPNLRAAQVSPVARLAENQEDPVQFRRAAPRGHGETRITRARHARIPGAGPGGSTRRAHRPTGGRRLRTPEIGVQVPVGPPDFGPWEATGSRLACTERKAGAVPARSRGALLSGIRTGP